MKVIKIKIADITRNPKNAKIHTEEQVRQIANSIERFGFCDPIGISGKDNWLVEGDGRLQAMLLLGRDEIDAIRLDHLTKEERRAYALAHNQTTLSTGFDLPILHLELEGLVDFNMGDFGFDLISPDREIQLPNYDYNEDSSGDLTFTLKVQIVCQNRAKQIHDAVLPMLKSGDSAKFV